MHLPVLIEPTNSGAGLIPSALYMPRVNPMEEMDTMMGHDFLPSLTCDGCGPPPEFLFPPPPRPSWLVDDSDDCRQTSDLSLLETCDHTLIIDAAFQESISSISLILLCSLLLVITLLLTSYMIFRRRKSGDPVGGTFGDTEGSCHQIYDDHIDIMATDDMSRRSSTPVSHHYGKQQQQQQQQQQRFVSALHSLKRGHLSIDSTAHLDAHFPNSTSLPNHYIHDSDRLQHSRNAPDSLRDFTSRFSTDNSAKRVQLCEAPPKGGEDAYPHILIGGQPFYLIPSNVDSQGYAYATTNLEEQAPPPIYEEIDRSYYYSHSLGSGISDRGEVGSLNRSDPSSDDGTHQLHPPSHLKRLPRRPTGPNNSVYYYSDTLRKPNPTPTTQMSTGPSQSSKCFRISSNKPSDDSDSGISNRSLAPTPKSSDSKGGLLNNNSIQLPIHETRVVILSDEKRGLERPAEV